LHIPPSIALQVVENAGQKGCVLLDLSADKKAQTKMLPGLLYGGEQGGCLSVPGTPLLLDLGLAQGLSLVLPAATQAGYRATPLQA